MLKKTCPKCGKPSYSASEFGLWLCSYCETSLRHIPAEPAGAEGNDDVIPKEQAQTGKCFWTGECFWCEAGECMLETSNDAYVCPVCGWRY